MTPEERDNTLLMEMLALDAKLRERNASRVVEEATLTPLEEAYQRVKEGKPARIDGRKAAGKRRAELNKRKKRQREMRQREELKARNRRWQRAVLTGSLYEIQLQSWKRRKLEVRLTKWEWDEYIQPCLAGGLLPVCTRYDVKLPIHLSNIVVSDDRNGNVLFDGKEWLGKQQGWFL